jgi:hypothetical protein
MFCTGFGVAMLRFWICKIGYEGQYRFMLGLRSFRGWIRWLWWVVLSIGRCGRDVKSSMNDDAQTAVSFRSAVASFSGRECCGET